MAKGLELMRGFDLRRAALAAVVALAVALLLCVPGMSLAPLPQFLVATLMFAAAIAVALTLAGNLRQGLAPALVVQGLAVLCACVVVTMLLSLMQGQDLWRLLRSAAGWQDIGSLASIGLVMGAAISFVMLLRERQVAAQAQHEAQAQLLEKQVLQARLQLLQAQVEPHFLFNTLASVQRLIQTDPPAAGTLLADLVAYLRAALPDMRETHSTVGREVALAAAYLSIMRVRMGQRLTFQLDVPDALRELACPPMMLMSLVENAIKHGVAHRAQGVIEIRAAANAQGLALSVKDNGLGFDAHAPAGVGLSNIRQRLQALYGPGAKLLLEEQNAGGGVTATLLIPHAHSAITPAADR